MNELPVITVIVLVYNSPDLIAALDSVLIQNYPRIQLIVIDDHSMNTDMEAVSDYLKENSNKNIIDTVLIRNEKNEGTARALNTGLRLSSGKYIFNLAGDDAFFDQNVLYDWVQEFIKTNALFITAKRAKCSENMDFICERPNRKQIRAIQQLPPKELFERIGAENFIFGCCTARSRESLEQFGLLDEQYEIIDDFPLFLKVLRSGTKINYFDRIVVRHRGGGVSSLGKINERYLSLSDRIMQNEVLPYTENRQRQLRKYNNWKKKLHPTDRFLRDEKKHIELKIKYGKKSLKYFFYQILFYCKYPKQFICRVSEKFF